ncbi:hypothetical protein E3P78_01934 [Wallemia ichthyophaga]|nr:hypothetical protein E3P78_01934 [Wallemia ichthyophaga]
MSCLDRYIESLSTIDNTRDLVALHGRLENDINDRRVELADKFNGNLSTHAHQLSQSLSISQLHSQIASKSDDIYLEIQQMKPSLEREVEQYRAHIEDYKQAKLEHEAKTILDSVHSSLSTLRRHIDSNDYSTAAQYLRSDMKSNIEQLQRSFVSRWDGSSTLQTEYYELSELLTNNLNSAWNESSKCTASSLTLKSLYGTRPLSEIVDALNTLKSFSNHYKNLYSSVKEYFVDTLLPPSTSKALIPTIVFSEDTLTLQPTTEAPIKSTQLKNLAIFLEFINKRYQDLGKQLTPLVLERLMDVYLLPSLPYRLGGPDVTLFQRRLDKAVDFENQVSQDGLIKKVSQNWGNYWIEQRQNRALKDARKVILRPNWDMFTAEISVLVKDSSDKYNTEDIERTISDDALRLSSQPNVDESNHLPDNEGDEDGWGFDDEEVLPQPRASIEKADSKTSLASIKDVDEEDGEKDEDGWGLDEEEGIEQLQEETAQGEQIGKPQLSRTESGSSITSPQPDIIANDDDDGWGLDDDEDVEIADDKQKVTPANPISDDDDPWKDDMDIDEAAAAASVPTKKDNISEDGWTLEDEERNPVKDSEWSETAKHTRIPQQEVDEKQIGQKRRIVVSEYVNQLIGLMDDVYSDKEFLKHTDEIPSSDKDLLKEATTVMESVIDIYRCLFPHVHQETIKLVPALALQFANDCEYLSHQTWQRELISNSKKLGMLNKKIMMEVDVEQKRQLVEMLTEAGSLIDLSIKHEKAFAGVISSISRLRSTVKGVISVEDLNQLLGSIAEFVMRFVIEAVEDLDDISEEDSNKVSKLCRELQAGIEEVFEENGTQGYKHTESWFKMAYLSEILEASLVDLSYLHEQGSLVDFTSEELVRLCKALFADTDKRAKVIDKMIAASAR